jgi:hypothetical protein
MHVITSIDPRRLADERARFISENWHLFFEADCSIVKPGEPGALDFRRSAGLVIQLKRALAPEEVAEIAPSLTGMLKRHGVEPLIPVTEIHLPNPSGKVSMRKPPASRLLAHLSPDYLDLGKIIARGLNSAYDRSLGAPSDQHVTRVVPFLPRVAQAGSRLLQA